VEQTAGHVDVAVQYEREDAFDRHAARSVKGRPISDGDRR